MRAPVKPDAGILGRADGRFGTATLAQMIRDVNSLLRTRLDKLMTAFRLGNPPFFAGYQSARVIIDRHDPGAPEAPPTP